MEEDNCKPEALPIAVVPTPAPVKAVKGKNAKSYVKNPKTGTFDCPICKKQNKVIFLADFHYTTFHLGKRYCDDGTAKPRTTRNRSYCGKYLFNSETGTYTCSKCQEVFTRQDSAWTHYDRFHVKKEFKCEKCSKVLADRSSLHKHRKICLSLPDDMNLNPPKKEWTKNEETGLYECPICPNKVTTYGGAKFHYETVHLGKRHICERCGRSFLQSSGFKKHRMKCKGALPNRSTVKS